MDFRDSIRELKNSTPEPGSLDEKIKRDLDKIDQAFKALSGKRLSLFRGRS